jgi:hypothetical protein
MNKPEPLGISDGGLIGSYGGLESLSRMRVEHQARIGGERIRGGTDFVEMALMQDASSLVEHAAVGQLGWGLQNLRAAILRHYQLDEESLLAG